MAIKYIGIAHLNFDFLFEPIISDLECISHTVKGAHFRYIVVRTTLCLIQGLTFMVNRPKWHKK